MRVGGDERRNGIFDPSVEYGDDGIGWLAYSSIDIPKFIETHIAKSIDHGATWSYVRAANTSAENSAKEKDESATGVWRFETPSLLFDPADKPARRWKLFTNRYSISEPFKPADRHMSTGTIDVQYSATPDGEWSRPTCIVGTAAHCRIDVARTAPALAEVKFTTEPGTIVEKGVIYMSLDAGTTDSGMGEWENYRVILLASSDHGEKWHYVGTLLDHSDAMRFDYLVFTGTSLVREKGKLYLMATPSGSTKKSSQDHDGTMVMEIADIAGAKLMRDDAGKPIVIKRLEVEKQSGGLADYDEQNTAGGIIFPQFTIFGVPEFFQIWNSGQTISDSP